MAKLVGRDAADVKRAVESYFSLVKSDSSRLPFDKENRIYSKRKFDSFQTVRCIPSIGRIGPSYTRYLKWRANVAAGIDMAPRSAFVTGYTEEDIEAYAEALLSGGNPEPPKKRKGTEMYKRVWLVGSEGKKQARQVIPKDKK